MNWNADYAGFVVAAYAIAFALLLTLLIYNLWRASTLKAKLAELKLVDPGQQE